MIQLFYHHSPLEANATPQTENLVDGWEIIENGLFWRHQEKDRMLMIFKTSDGAWSVERGGQQQRTPPDNSYFVPGYQIQLLKMISSTLSIIFLNLVSLASGFTIQQKLGSRQYISTSFHAAPDSLEDLIDISDQWDPIKNDLNMVPAFACTNDQGQPLQYDVGTGPLAFFFLDIDAAKDELQKAKDDTKMEGLNLVPFPLGEVFEMAAKKLAMVVPPQKGIEAAGAPSGMNPLGQQVPLFGCMDVVETLADGTSMVPLFLSMDEAKEALNMALEGLPADEQSKFDVTVMPLAGAVQMQATNSDKSFTYVAPRSSLDYLQSLE